MSQQCVSMLYVKTENSARTDTRNDDVTARSLPTLRRFSFVHRTANARPLTTVRFRLCYTSYTCRHNSRASLMRSLYTVFFFCNTLLPDQFYLTR